MVSTAIVFPGQGSRKPGMARDFHDGFAAARAVFAEASEALSVASIVSCKTAEKAPAA